MIEIVKRKLEQKMLEKRGPHDLVAGRLFDHLYNVLDTKKVSPQAQVFFRTFMTVMFKCTKCDTMNTKACTEAIMKSEIDWENTRFEQLSIFARSLWSDPRGTFLQDIIDGRRCEECGKHLGKGTLEDIIREPVIRYMRKCEDCKTATSGSLTS